jgi:divalent metal cation (Fe/Co/Zn/Cd) transporter
VAALFVSVLVVSAAYRLGRRNVDVLMDRAPADDVSAARRAIATLDPPVELRRLRLRRAAGRAFVDVVIGVSPGAAVGQGHAVADRVEAGVERALPGADVVVHVEPSTAGRSLDERIRAAAATVPVVREIHNLSVIEVGETGIEVSLHLKLPGDLSLEEAHAAAEQVEREIAGAVPEVVEVQTHLEPLGSRAEGRDVTSDDEEVARRVREAVGDTPRSTRLVRTDGGLVVFLTLELPPDATLEQAHGRASAVEERIRSAVPGIADVIVHTEPG